MALLTKFQRERFDYFIKYMGEGVKGQKILDIGCQNGMWCRQLRDIGHEPFGIDVQEDSVINAKKLHPDIPFIMGNCQEELPFADGELDIVWAGDVIEHICFTDVFINEINRVLKVGGKVVLTTPVHGRIKNILISFSNFETHFYPEYPHVRFYTRKSLSGVLEKRGFSVVHVDYIGRFRPVARTIFLVAEKQKNKMVLSEHQY